MFQYLQTPHLINQCLKTQIIIEEDMCHYILLLCDSQKLIGLCILKSTSNKQVKL